MDKKRPLEINYVFFLICLFFSLIFVSFTVIDIENISLYPRAFFLIYSYGQVILEVVGIAILSWIVKRFLPKKIFLLFMGFCFFFFIRHMIDFLILKIMDMTIWDGLDIALDENIENFIEMLHTTGIPFFAWIIFAILGFLVPFLGAFIYKLTDTLSQKKILKIYPEHFIQAFFCLPLALVIWDMKAAKSITPNTYAIYQRALPWKVTFYQPKTLSTEASLTLKKPKKQEELKLLIDNKNLQVKNKPNIFIFIIESLREDYITAEIAPNIYKFKKENISFKHSLSNANATHHSWFSLFYSSFPYNWKIFKDASNRMGSTALNILKKMDYDINVYSAPELKYYAMGEVLFGKNQHLAASFNIYPHYHPVEACDSDKNVFENMKKELKEDKNVYIGFLDSTHFLYSWPKDFKIKFKPAAEIESFKAYTSKDNISLIKNRYKNSILFVDSLLNDFFNTLKEKNLYDDSIIVILGDHGEEFYEQGHLFHASHLSAQQTTVPIYLKLGKNIRKVSSKKNMICHMDVFPSIFDYIFEKNVFDDVFEGESVFTKDSFPFVITTRYNASRAPKEFFIHKGDKKVTFRFKNKKEIFKKQHLEIVSIKDLNDEELILSSEEDLKPFEKALDRLFIKE